MEFEQLRDIWKQNPFPEVRNEQIAEMLKGRSRSIVSSLKRNAWAELLLTAVGFGVLLYYTVTDTDKSLQWSLIAFTVLFAGFIAYYIRKIVVLNQFDAEHDNIRASIIHLTDKLNIYLKFYRIGSIILYPLYLLLVLFFVAMEHGVGNLIYSLSRPGVLIYLIPVVLFILIFSLWLGKWYDDKLYGNHVRKLKELLNDLATDAEDSDNRS